MPDDLVDMTKNAQLDGDLADRRALCVMWTVGRVCIAAGLTPVFDGVRDWDLHPLVPDFSSM